MEVKLIAHTPDALRVAFSAIRTCYSSSDFKDIWEKEYNKYVENNNDHIRLVKQIVSHGHTSTLEHVSFTFSISNITRTCMAQITRHRIASYSVRSQRYTKLNSVADCKLDGNPIYEAAVETMQQAYRDLLEEGIKPEDARMILPQSASTNLVMTINLRSFINLYNARKPGTHAQEEFQTVADAMKLAIVAAEPWTESLF